MKTPLSEKILELKREVIDRIIRAKHIKTKLETSICLERELINPIIELQAQAIKDLKVQIPKRLELKRNSGKDSYIIEMIEEEIDKIMGSFNHSPLLLPKVDKEPEVMQSNRDASGSDICSCGHDKIQHYLHKGNCSQCYINGKKCKKFKPKVKGGKNGTSNV